MRSILKGQDWRPWGTRQKVGAGLWGSQSRGDDREADTWALCSGTVRPSLSPGTGRRSWSEAIKPSMGLRGPGVDGLGRYCRGGGWEGQGNEGGVGSLGMVVTVGDLECQEASGAGSGVTGSRGRSFRTGEEPEKETLKEAEPCSLYTWDPGGC